MRCVIHIGTEKTGSTAIQRYLLHHKDELSLSGVHCCESYGKGNNRAFAAAFTAPDRRDDYFRQNDLDDPESRKQWFESLAAQFDTELQETGETIGTFLISSEHLHSRLQSASEVRAVADFVLPRFSSVEIRCYLRRQDELALSRFSEALRAGYAPPALLPKGQRPLSTQPAPYFDYAALLDRWALAFGDAAVHPRIFSRESLFKGDVVADFLQSIGQRKAPESKVIRANEALPATTQAAIYMLNRHMAKPHSVEGRVLRKRLVAMAEQMGISGDSLLPCKTAARNFYQKFEAGNREVAKRWFGRDTLFVEDFSRYPLESTRLDSSRVASLLGGLLLAVAGEGENSDSFGPVLPKKPLPDFNWS
ncbi:hypothetical protein FV139_16515 [Parahaliea maris]|uniref:Uncharacterized protein n=1 Tax=Parahaliea maris TaxID=2716870 RepID=A0A5C8ZU85_9GAMM|nr:hypothetical protein [Parahaliea maris]TXS91334.1 hypothetical protein FV139_16515 [Parahaliea maris]